MPPHFAPAAGDPGGEARFRRALEEAPFPILMHAEDGEVLAISRAWSELTGYSKDDIPTIAAWTVLAYGERKDAVRADIQALYDLTRRKDEGEYTIRCADGSQRVWEFSSIGLGRLPDGRRVALSMAHDVTDRKRAQQRAEAALTQLSRVFERVTDAFVALDRDWRYTYVNRRAGEIFGRRPEDLIGKHIWTEFPEGIGQPFHRAYERAMAEQKPLHIEDYYAPYDRWFENIVYPSPDGLSIYFHDITERKRAEDERSAALARFETLFRNAPEAITISERATGRFLHVNDAFCALAGYAREELVGRTSLELNLWGETARRAQIVAALDAGRRVVADVGLIRTRSGELRDIRFSADRIDFGGTPGLLMMFVDVTEQRRAQRQVEAHEQQLAELARRLMTKEEEERKALAQTLHDRFAQNLAAAKLGVEGALLKAQAAGDGSGALGAALRGVIGSLDEAIADVRGLLTELRPPLLNEFGLRAALRQEIDSRRALNQGVAIDFAPGGDVAAWPPQRLTPAAEFGLFYIAREALTNALLHAAARRVELALDIDARRAIITVRDDGAGFDAGQAQAHGHLGLTGMRERAALIGATLDIDSRIGRGTTVTVVCPAGADTAGRTEP